MIKDLEYKISQIESQNDGFIKERDSTIEDIMNKLAIKTTDYNVTSEKLIEAKSAAEILREKNSNLKMENESKIENLETEIQKLQKQIDHVENEKQKVTTDLSTKLARTEEILIGYREQVNDGDSRGKYLS